MRAIIINPKNFSMGNMFFIVAVNALKMDLTVLHIDKISNNISTSHFTLLTHHDMFVYLMKANHTYIQYYLPCTIYYIQ